MGENLMLVIGSVFILVLYLIYNKFKYDQQFYRPTPNKRVCRKCGAVHHKDVDLWEVTIPGDKSDCSCKEYI